MSQDANNSGNKNTWVSLHATKWAWEVDVSSSSARLVLLALAKYADMDGGAYPSADTIAEETHLNRKTVFAALSELCQSGLVVRTNRSGYGRRNQYELRLDSTYFGTSQKRDIDSTENGTYQKRNVPKTVRSSSQKRDFESTENGTSNVPNLGHEYRREERREKNNEERSFSPASAPAPVTVPKTGRSSDDEWASILAEPAPVEDDYPADLLGDVIPDPAPDAAPASKPATKKPKRSRAAANAWPVEGDSIDAETRAAYIAVRKAKRVGPFTAKAYEQIKAQGEKFGRSMVETLGICIGRGWVYPYDSAFQQTTMNGKSNGIQEDRRGFVLTPQSEYDYEAGLRMFEERRAARRARDA